MRIKYTELRMCCLQGVTVTFCAYNDAEEYIIFISQTTNFVSAVVLRVVFRRHDVLRE